MNKITVELKNKVFVRQFVNRIAKTGSKMISVEILIDCVDGCKLTLPTLWSDMNYRLAHPIIIRINKLVSSMLADGQSIKSIRNELHTRYYSGFPKKQNCSDYERFKIKIKRLSNKPPRMDGYYDLKGRTHGFFYNEFINSLHLSSWERTFKFPFKYKESNCGCSIRGGYTTVKRDGEFIPKWKGFKINSRSFVNRKNRNKLKNLHRNYC